MISIRAIWQSTGKPAQNRKVSIHYSGGLFSGGFSPTQYTDSSGETHFDHESAECTVYIDGSSRWSGRLSGMKTFYI